MDALESTRRLICETAFQEHEFPAEVIGTGGWEYDGLDTFKRTVFLNRECEASAPIIFFVEFESGSACVQTAGCRENI
jgi:hypothetical protein